jgi:hypothetical protein
VIFCFDLDYTLAAPVVPFWQIAAENLGLPVPNAFLNWGFPEFPKALADECHKLFKMNWYMNDMLRPESHVHTLLQSLARQGHTNYIITARHKEVQDGTRGWVIEHLYPSVRDVFFVPWGISKGELLQSLRADFWVDDKAADCFEAASLGIQTLLVRRPWNWSVKENGEIRNLEVCKNMYDVAQKLRKWSK